MAEQREHHGVGVVVTNAGRTRFFVQQKDDRYPVYPLCYSFFGGEREDGESPEQALHRELCEELGARIAGEVTACGLCRVFDGAVGASDGAFRFTLFEAVADDATLDRLAAVEVLEGERGAVFEREALRGLPFVWSLGDVVRAYLDG